MNSIKFFQIVEVTVGATVAAAGQIAFPDVPNLRNDDGQKITILDIEFYPISIYAKSVKNPAVPGMPNADVPNGSLVLYVHDGELIKNIPLGRINYTQADPATFLAFQQERTTFDKLQDVEWLKCYVQQTAAPTAPPYVIPFGVTYLRTKLK